MFIKSIPAIVCSGALLLSSSAFACVQQVQNKYSNESNYQIQCVGCVESEFLDTKSSDCDMSASGVQNCRTGRNGNALRIVIAE